MPLLNENVTPDRVASANLDARVHQARMTMVVSRTMVPIVVGMPFACLMVMIVWPSFSHAALLGWLACKLLSAGARIVERIVRRNLAPAPGDTHAERQFLLLLAVDGLVWGLALVIFPEPAQLASSAILYACVVGVAAIAASSLGNWFRAHAIFMAAMLLPGVLAGVVAGNLYEGFAAASIAALLGLMLNDGRLAGIAAAELLRRRFDMDRLATERADALALAERHSAVKSRFLASMSHEMRTPLHGMLGTLQVLRNDVPPAQIERLALIERAGEHLLRVINDVLDFSKIEAGHMVTDAAPYECGKVLHDVIDLFAQTANSQGVALILASALPTPSWTLGDAARVRQILLNLVGNALKFTSQGQVGIDARIVDGALTLAVSDTGIGIPASEEAFIFDAFRQVEDGDTRRYSGTGLGLTISRELARAMGGDLVCHSTHGQGSVFTLTLPWRPSSEPAVVASAIPASAPPVLATTLRGTVLLVDDNPVNLMVAEAMLEKLGLDIVVAADGEQAIAAFVDRQPSIVLMDCQMPVLDGYAATGRIREIEARDSLPRTPVIAVTANALDDDRTRCLDAGMDDHLGKPFRQQDLAALLQRYMTPA